MTGENIEVRNAGARPETGHPVSHWSYRPRIDVTESIDGFRIVADLPGATPEGIRIDCRDRTLAIHATVPARQAVGTEYLAHEYGVGDFDREFLLPEAIEADQVTAEYHCGVLTIDLPRCEAAKPRRIPVRAI
jgi:HSP20 family protein